MSIEGNSETVETIEAFRARCRKARRLIEETRTDTAVPPTVYLDAAVALAEMAVSGWSIVSDLVRRFLSGRLPAKEFAEGILHFPLSELPDRGDLFLPAYLITHLNQNRVWTASSGPPKYNEHARSALWSLFNLHDDLLGGWDYLEPDFEWSKWAAKVPSELHPAEAPDLKTAFAIYVRLETDSVAGRCFDEALRSYAESFQVGEDDGEGPVLLRELREEVRAVKRRLAGLPDQPLEAAGESQARDAGGSLEVTTDEALQEDFEGAVSLPSAPDAKLTATERAIAIYLRDPSKSVRAVARQARCNPSLLYRDPRFRRLRAAHQATLPKGTKSKDGDLEAEDER